MLRSTVVMAEGGWIAVGRYLGREQRVRGFRTRTDFADYVGISVRTMDNLLNGRRSRYAAATIVAVEVAMSWQPGSVARVVGGGRPARQQDREMDRIVRVWPRLPAEARRILAHLAEDAVPPAQ